MPWNLSNPESKKKYYAYLKEYRKQPRVLAKIRKYYKDRTPEQKEKYKLKTKEWHDATWERTQKRVYEKKQVAKLRTFQKLGGRCSNPGCGWINPDGSRGCMDDRCLQIDHVHGGGCQETMTKGTLQYYNHVFEDNTGKYQLLCANCNWIKRFVNNEHKGRRTE